MKEYKDDLSFQRVFMNLKYFKKFTEDNGQETGNNGVTTSKILIDDEDQDDKDDEEAWIGLSR